VTWYLLREDSGDVLEQVTELNGALSNPFVTDKSLLIDLNDLCQILLQKALHTPLRPRPRPAWPRRSPVLETVTRVLERAERPMRAREIHRAACELHGAPLRWPSVKDALSAYTRGGDRRFRRLGRGVYQLAREGSPSTDPEAYRPESTTLQPILQEPPSVSYARGRDPNPSVQTALPG
jgi:hypothetical protein